MQDQRSFATEIVQRLRSAGHIAYFAGGCVRDLLLGRPAKDYDVATSAHPQEVRHLFGHRKTLAVGESFGVIIVLGGRNTAPVEVATFRADLEYHDGRRPSGVVYCSPEEDAERRDFTINGMFYDPVDSRVLDYVHGERDLAARIVRAIRNPRERMNEDKLRMIRAVRFTAALDFELDEATAAAVRAMAPELTVVSAERIAQELRKMLVDSHRRRAIDLCDELRLLPVIFPELAQCSAENVHADRQALALLSEPGFELALATLLQDISVPTVEAICRRLKLSNDETDRTTWLVAQRDTLLGAPTMPLAKLKRLLAHPFRGDLLSLTRARLLAREADLHPVLFTEEFLTRHTDRDLDPPPLISGADLIQSGLKPGPRFKELLESVRDAQLEGRIDSRDAALAHVQQLHAFSAESTP